MRLNKLPFIQAEAVIQALGCVSVVKLFVRVDTQ